MMLISRIIGTVMIGLIRVYQKTLSFDHGPLRFLFPYGHCRFTPSCSEYGIEAIRKYGPIKGLLMSIWRIMRCNPFNRGGHDPVK